MVKDKCPYFQHSSFHKLSLLFQVLFQEALIVIFFDTLILPVQIFLKTSTRCLAQCNCIVILLLIYDNKSKTEKNLSKIEENPYIFIEKFIIPNKRVHLKKIFSFFHFK